MAWHTSLWPNVWHNKRSLCSVFQLSMVYGNDSLSCRPGFFANEAYVQYGRMICPVTYGLFLFRANPIGLNLTLRGWSTTPPFGYAQGHEHVEWPTDFQLPQQESFGYNAAMQQHITCYEAVNCIGEKGEKYDSKSIRLYLVSHHEHGGGMGCTTFE